MTATREPIRAIRLNDGTYYVPGDVQVRRAAPAARLRRPTIAPATAVRTGAVAAGVTVGAGVVGGTVWVVTEAVAWVVAHGVMILGGAVALGLVLILAGLRVGSSCSTTVTFTHRH
jgi:hypothetical protein